MSFITYAQNLEDLMLWRALKHVKNGYYIDIGAFDPVEHSVTKAFYDIGWCGINVEPTEEAFERLQQARPNDINVRSVIGKTAGEQTLYLFRNTGLSTTSEANMQNIVAAGFGNPETIQVNSISFDSLCDENDVNDIHFLKIDAEMSEKEILEGAAFKKYRPWIIVIEATEPFSNNDISASWEHVLLDKGYEVAYFDGLNKFYVAIEHRELRPAFSLPPNVIDDYVHGSTLALRAANQQALAELEQEKQHSVRQKADLEQQSADLRQQSRDLQAVKSQLALSASQLATAQQELARVYASRSWKLTEALRQTNSRRQQVVERTLHNAKAATKRLLDAAYPAIAGHPVLKNGAKRILDRFPVVRQRVLQVLAGRQARLATREYRGSHTAGTTLATMGDVARAQQVLPGKERIVLIYVEHTASFDRITGIQRVCHQLSANLESNGERVVLVKLDPATLQLAPLNDSERTRFQTMAGYESASSVHLYEARTFASMMAGLRERVRPSWLLIPEVCYHTHHVQPPTGRLIKVARDAGLRVGAIYYDIIPLLTKDAAENALKHAAYTSTLALADVIWPISRYSGELLRDFYVHNDGFSDEDMPEISVATLAEETATPRQAKRGQQGPRRILCVGTIDERKNQATLIKAFDAYCRARPDTDVVLDIAGYVRPDYRLVIEALAANSRNINFHYNASDQDIQRLYAECHFSVFPSLEEGYGLPVVESLWALKPCICANFSSMAELHNGGGCLAADTRRADDLLAAITALLEDKQLFDSKVEEILQRPAKTWFEYAAGISADMDRLQFGSPCAGPIYYWVDATVSAPSNTGIQRVNRQLARNLILQGHRLVPIKWDESAGAIGIASTADLEHLARWNGPPADGWDVTAERETIDSEATYLLVELPLNRPLDVQEQVIAFFQQRGAFCAAVFYDAIPYKLAGVYPAGFTQAHTIYMELLDRMDLVLPISSTSANDLTHFLAHRNVRALSLETRIQPVDLPAEFPERSARDVPRGQAADPTCHILSVGTVEPRKNHETLIRAFFEAEIASPRRLHLTIMGGAESFDRELPDRIAALIGQSASITWIKSAPDTQLVDAYATADFTVFPSYEEGFGMPIMESLWMGTPCICSRSGQMGELAADGGCEAVDVLNVRDLASAIVRLANDPERLDELKAEIKGRHFANWTEYSAKISGRIRQSRQRIASSGLRAAEPTGTARTAAPPRPTLSVCVTTYNRAGWLAVNLQNLMQVSASVRSRVEIVVCDNCSTDETSAVATRFVGQENYRSIRNSANVGMLGNLCQTVEQARGDYIWLIGDDDLLHQGALERILSIIDGEAPDLINVNYAYTPDVNPPDIRHLDAYFANAIKIADGSPSMAGKIKDISAFNENFYTAIYTFIVKRKHAQKIFNQDTSGAPFSSLQTCVPSSKYILSRMMDMRGYWINEPQITINMNVSWGKYAPLWILERLPEVYDLAELNGVSPEQADRWRRHTLQMALNFLKMLFEAEPDPAYATFDIERFIRRSRHLDVFRALYPQIEAVYAGAREQQHPLARIPVDELKAVMQ